ncbi:MAG: hypothetical protein ACTSRI_06665 [Promethearchaeota archaeon]
MDLFDEIDFIIKHAKENNITIINSNNDNSIPLERWKFTPLEIV